MARASGHLEEGFTYHLTQRCINREFLLRFVRDRDVFREWMREAVWRFRVSVFGYNLTRNHVHVLAHADRAEAVSGLMHLASGSTAKQYNLRKNREGSLWEHPYQCTRIQDGRHLFNCLCYIDLNMVRAGVVRHPREWRWCGYEEIMGLRKRLGILDVERLMEHLQVFDPAEFRAMYEEALQRRIDSRILEREPQWTESLAVGSKAFIDEAAASYPHRLRLQRISLEGDSSETWILRESRPTYGAA